MKYSRAGTTLIEVLVYSMIFIIVVGGMMMLAFAMLTSAEQANSQIEVSDNARLFIQNVEVMVRNASSINSPFPGASANSLSLNIDPASYLQNYATGAGWGLSANPIVYTLVNGVLTLQIAAVVPFPITNSFVTVSGLTFSNNQYSPETKNTIRVRAKITSVQPINPASVSLDFSVSID